MDKKVVIAAILSLGLLVGLFAVAGNKPKATVDFDGNPFEVQDDDWIRGSKSAKVTLIEYADFQCPACRSYTPILSQLEKKYENNLRVIFRHFPLITIHPNSMAAHRAAQAAGLQGKFWQMHDILYQRQDQWASLRNPVPTFESYARELSLDIDKYNTDYKSQAVFDAISKGQKSGNKLGVSATPTFILDGKLIDNPASFDDFAALIEGELNQN